jgi:hypothetical protein
MNFMTRFYRNQILHGTFFSRNLSKIISAAFFATVILSINGCEKAPSKIGAGLLPGSDYLTIISDTFAVKSYTMYTAKVRSEDPTTSYLGEIHDPIFGVTRCGFVTQLTLSADITPDSVAIVKIDSVVLHLNLLTVQGDTNVTHTLKVSEIDQQLYYYSVPAKKTVHPYYSNSVVPLTGDEWTVQIPALRGDTINTLSLKLPDSLFAVHLFRDRTKLFLNKDTSAHNDFLTYFKGLKFEIEPSGNPIFASLSVSKPGSSSQIANYFSIYIEDDHGDQQCFNILLDPKNYTKAAFNLYEHIYSSGTISHINDNNLDSLTYAQNMNGVYIRMEIPGMAAMKNNPLYKNIGINKARLILPYVIGNGSFTNTTIPPTIYVRYVSPKGIRNLVGDYIVAGSAFYDGTADTNNLVYNVNIATYLQSYIEDTVDSLSPELELFVLPTSTYNLVLRSNNNLKTSTKFELTYSKF